MPKSSKALVLVDPTELQPERAAYHHHHTRLHVAIGIAHGVLCGFEMERIQGTLKKYHSDTFEGWLEKHQAVLGFSRITAFRYKAVSDNVKSKLLSNGDHDVLALIDRHPASLNEAESSLLLKAVEKAVDGQSLRELLEEIKLARRPHGAALRNQNSPGGEIPDRHVPIEQLVQEEMEFIGGVLERFSRKVKIGKDEVSILSQLPLDRIDTLIALFDEQAEELRQIKKARSKK
jgi:hypothetical protein